MQTPSAPEIAIAVIEQVLRCKVDVSDNLFQLGATSLAVALISTELERALAGEVPIRMIYECASVQELMTRLDEGRTAAAGRR